MRELERRFAQESVVIGVHAGKFRAERITANIAQATQRLGVHHAVVNDRQYRIWRAYGVNAWPTVVLIDPEGGFVGALPGEFLAEDLAPALQDIIDESAAHGRLSRAPLALTLPPEPQGVLRFPGKVLAVSRSRLFAADSGHDRILELEVDWGGGAEASPGAAPQASPGAVTSASPGAAPRARVVRRIGSGQRGAADGTLAQAQFDHPQGMALGRAAAGGELLYVADSENHTIRAVDLARGEVTTLAGTGAQARRSNQPGVGTSVALSSPWDVALLDGALVIAMAGTHQLWRLVLATLEAAPWVGTGREDISDGPASRCTLAQPMGLSLARVAGAAEGGRAAGEGGRLYFADSESSAIRFVDLGGRTGPEVTTVVGRGLFEFGDQDGKGGHVRLQHPYAVAAHEGALYVADTYNNKIKRLSPDGRSETFAGTGEEGLRDGEAVEACFDEPQGLAVAGGALYVADTNNHALRAVDLTAADMPRVHTVEIAE